MTQWSPPTLAAQITMGILFGSLVFVGFLGNILVCIAIYTNKRLRKKENLYFVSLAWADLFLSVLVMPFAAFNDIAGHWLFGEYCKIWMSLDIMCCTCSILHLCAISFDRYYHINDPMLYSERMTGRKILTAIFIVWTLSSAIAFVPLSFDTHFDKALIYIWTNSTTINANSNGNGVGQGQLSTTPNTIVPARKLYQCSFNLEPIYAIISSMVSFYLPSVIMIGAYTKLYRYAQRHAQTIRHQMKAATSLLLNASTQDQLQPPQQQQPSQSQSQNQLLQPPQPYHHAGSSGSGGDRKRRCRLSTSSTQQNSTAGGTTPLSHKRRELISSDSNARVTLGAIVGTFLCSWFPFFVCNIIRSFCSVCIPDWLFVTLTWMGYANSAQNPIIYSIFNRDFRYAFRKILLCNRSSRSKRGGNNIGGGSATGCSVTGADDLVIVNGHTTTIARKTSDYNSYYSASTAV